MAKLAPTVDDLIEDLQCPVCLEVLQDPVSQGCGHNLCKLCMEKVCAGNAYVSCPVCRKTFPAKDYAVNKLLTMLLENVQKSLLDKSENPLPSNMCPEHIEPLKLFCKTDGNLGCVVCMVSSVHEDHIFIPVQEAVTTYRKDLNITLSALTLLSKNLSELQNQQDEKISSIQEISNRLEQHIKTQFAKLYESLQMMEQQCIQDLKQEAFQALKKMKENLCGITEKNRTVQQQMVSLKYRMEEIDPLRFLTGIKDDTDKFAKSQTIVLSELTPVTHSLSPGKFHDFLHYDNWNDFKVHLRPALSCVTLDPDTARKFIAVSEDLTCASYNGEKRSQETPQRFTEENCVLGSEGFSSGKHCWEVDVQNNREWAIGVISESVDRKKSFRKDYTRLWIVCKREWEQSHLWDFGSSSVKGISTYPKKIRVYLDYKGNKVSFYDADSMSHFCSFKPFFSEKIYPIFFTCPPSFGSNSSTPFTLIQL